MIKSRQDRHVQIIEFARPERKNAFSGTMYQRATEAVLAAEADPEISVLLLTGSGNAFSAGNDMDDFVNAPPDGPEAPPFLFLNALATAKKPVIAAVNGLAIGIGSTLLFHCDLVYAEANARFSLPFVNLGLVPEGASSLLLPRLVGHPRAAEILFFGDFLTAAEAHTIGLINTVVTEQPVFDFALQKALRLTQLPSGAIRATKALMKQTPEILAHIRAEAIVLAARTQTPAAQEAFSAFMQKRKPDFTGLD